MERNYDHRLSRVLAYDGRRAAAKGKREEGRKHEAKESKATEKAEHLGYDGASGDEGIVSKAIRRAKEFVGIKDQPKTEPKSKDPGKRPPTGQKKVLDRKLNPDTGELEDKPGAAVKLGNDAPPRPSMSTPTPRKPKAPKPFTPVAPPNRGPAAGAAPPAPGPAPTPGRAPLNPVRRSPGMQPLAGGLGMDGYTLKHQVTKEGSAFDGKCIGKDGKVGKVMHEFKHGELHSGSKSGPKVKNRKQAIAIGLSEARKEGEKV